MSEYRVTASSLHFRSEPRITSDAVGYLSKGDVVECVSISGDGYWLKIKFRGMSGWASHKYLAQVEKETFPHSKFPWMPIAQAEIGVKEFPGDRDNPRVVEYLKSTNLAAPSSSNDETPWCSAFVNWCVERSGYEGTDSAWARSWLKWGKKAELPVVGCVVVFERGIGSGHVAFFVREEGEQIYVLGGNQADEVKIAPYPKSRLLGYRVP